METSGAAIRAVYMSFYTRLFTFNRFKIPSAYHVEITRYGEMFLFPCIDEKEQKQIIEQIKQLIESGGKIA